MRKPNPFALNLASFLGMLLMSCAFMLLLSAFIHYVFQNNYLFHLIFVPVYQYSDRLTILLFVIMPALGILLNLVWLFQIKARFYDDEWVFFIHLRRNFINWMIVISGFASIFGVFSYVFFENLMIVAR